MPVFLTKKEAKRRGKLGGLAAARNNPKDVLSERAAKGGVALRSLYGSAFFGFIGRLPRSKRKT